MLLANLVCSDPGCEEEIEVSVRRLAQLEGFACGCGHGFVLVSVSELSEPGGELVSIATRRDELSQRTRAA